MTSHTVCLYRTKLYSLRDFRHIDMPQRSLLQVPGTSILEPNVKQPQDIAWKNPPNPNLIDYASPKINMSPKKGPFQKGKDRLPPLNFKVLS